MDAFIFQQINRLALRNLWLDSLGIFFAHYFPYILAIYLFLLLIWNFKKYCSAVILALFSGVLARGITELIRFLWVHPRPFVNNHVNLLIEHINSASFPSGHASFFFAISIVLFFYNKKLGTLFFIASFLISGARVYCGIHWPYDILGGFLVGIISGLIVIKISKILKK